MAGYSKTTLSKKIGIKENYRVRVVNAPVHYVDLLHPLPDGVKISNRLTRDIDIWHIFIKSKNDLSLKLQTAMKHIPDNGMIWVSWPKKSSGVISDITEGSIRDAAFPLGLVDIKVCAVDEIWSGLKLVIRKINRKKKVS